MALLPSMNIRLYIIYMYIYNYIYNAFLSKLLFQIFFVLIFIRAMHELNSTCPQKRVHSCSVRYFCPNLVKTGMN
jgi:hypothetical protein